jgi:uncharacterized membrane protein
MESRPKLKPEQNTADRIIEIAGCIAVAIIWFITLYFFKVLPGTVPTHFNVAGTADGFGPKAMVFLLPALGTLLFIGLTILNNYPHVFNYPVRITSENALKQYTMATRLIRVLKLAIVLIFTMLSWMTSSSALKNTDSIGAWFLPMILIIVFVPLGIYIVKSFKAK